MFMENTCALTRKRRNNFLLIGHTLMSVYAASNFTFLLKNPNDSFLNERKIEFSLRNQKCMNTCCSDIKIQIDLQSSTAGVVWNSKTMTQPLPIFGQSINLAEKGALIKQSLIDNLIWSV